MNPKFESQLEELAGKLGKLDIDAYTPQQMLEIRLEALMVIRDLKQRVDEFEQLSSSGTKLSMQASRWLAAGERGVSSNTIFTRLTGVNAVRGAKGYPHDPDDFRRCRLLLEQVPELRDRLPAVADVSPEWARLVESWDELCTIMDEETPAWREGKGEASRTYDRMRAVLYPKTAPASGV